MLFVKFKPTRLPKWILNHQVIKMTNSSTEAVQGLASYLKLFRPCLNGKMVGMLSTFQAALMAGIQEFQCMEGMED